MNSFLLNLELPRQRVKQVSILQGARLFNSIFLGKVLAFSKKQKEKDKGGSFKIYDKKREITISLVN